MRTFLYRSDKPEGRIFEGEDAVAEAIHDGWVDSPGDDTAAGTTSSAGRDPDDGMNPEDEPEDEPTQLKDVLTMTVPVARELIMAETSTAALKAILAREHTRERGPRIGVLDAVEERIGELATD